MFSRIKHFGARVGAGTLGLMTAGSAFAAEGDLTALQEMADFSTVQTVVLAIGGSLMGLYVVIKGIQFVIGMIRSRA